MKTKKGFTLVELVMIIVIIAIVAVIAVPKFVDFQTQATQKAEDYTVGCIRTGLELDKYDAAAQDM